VVGAGGGVVDLKTRRIKRAAQIGLPVYLVCASATLGASFVAGFPWQALLVPQLVLPVVIWVVVGRQPLAGLGFRRYPGWRRQLGLATIVAVGVCILRDVIAAATGLLGGSGAPAPAAAAAGLAVALAVALLFTAVPEETVFRGFLQRALSAWLTPPVGIAVSALLFALAHLPNRTREGWPPVGELILELTLLMVFGLLMSWTVWRSGGLWFAIGWHFGSNFPGVAEQFLFNDQLRGPAWLVGVPAAPFGSGLLGLTWSAAEVVIVVLLALSLTAARGQARAPAHGSAADS
jgi:membrane protease YdiL (CAAX protease family)